MKKIHSLRLITLGLLLTFCCIFSVKAQEAKDKIVPPQELETIIDSIAELAALHYISEEIGKEMGSFIIAQYKKGAYKQLSYEALGKAITNDFYTISNDHHNSAFYRQYQKTAPQSLLATKLDEYGEASNYGYTEVKIDRQNIGYLQVAHFTQWAFFGEAKIAANNAIEMLQHTDALIIDLRNNPGGFEDIVAHLMSYFFDQEPLVLQTYYNRFEDRKRSIAITEKLPGKKMPHIPIYLLINEKTGSAAESFAYMMKHLERATLIGETSSGAGNGSSHFRISDQFMVQIATWETINAITQTSWEKVGVIPHIACTSDEAYDKAYELAKIAAQKHKEQKIESYKQLFKDIDLAISSYQANSSNDQAIINSLKASHQQGLIKEEVINNMGYDYLYNHKNAPIATAIFKANTFLYPQSANVYDSYGEALLANEQFEEAVKSYQKAVYIAKENNDTNIHLYEKGLKNAKGFLQKK